ncbi:hypothetical protein TEA_015054 [Camellia sinensis var. sinensis]|uniref:CMP/dCMP-type deaminase domain-containing protein n=1 Tax=Camellia sinensis var. sinensis TaxID=542762 RepID=A0A4S4EDA7_CAMSN|nr:hypothetical protein TEA_015054 [Camellia sinensis var. sinensis]
MASCVEQVSLETVAFMELAVHQATLAMDSLEVPVGHAEMEAIDVLLEKWKQNGLSEAEVANKFSKCTLYVTCEPCIMCAAALSILGIKEVYYGCANDKFGGCGSILSLHLSSSEPLIRLVCGYLHHAQHVVSPTGTTSSCPYLHVADLRVTTRSSQD